MLHWKTLDASYIIMLMYQLELHSIWDQPCFLQRANKPAVLQDDDSDLKDNTGSWTPERLRNMAEMRDGIWEEMVGHNPTSFLLSMADCSNDLH